MSILLYSRVCGNTVEQEAHALSSAGSENLVVVRVVPISCAGRSSHVPLGNCSIPKGSIHDSETQRSEV